MNLPNTQNLDTVEGYKFEPIKGYPMLHWKGKRPFTSTQFYPAQQKESHGADVDGWRNKIFWGDNLQVMSHLLKDFRGKVNLVYIDPPFDSKADYKKKIQLRGQSITNDQNIFEEKQYGDLWVNDEYLQFIYERLILIREFLHNEGSLWVHCDWHRNHHLRCVMDEVFGVSNFMNEVVWQRTDPHNDAISRLGFIHDNILWYAKNREDVVYNWKEVAVPISDSAEGEYSLLKLDNGDIVKYHPDLESKGRRIKLENCTYKGKDPKRQFVWRGVKPSPNRVWTYKTPEEMDEALEKGELYLRDPSRGSTRCKVYYLDESIGKLLQTIWTDCGRMKGGIDYPTTKPEALIRRIIEASSNKGDLVFDCFMGSGTTQAVAMKLGRRFIGADINLGAVQITTKRLLGVAEELEQKKNSAKSLQLSIPKVPPKLRAIEGGKATDPVMTKRAAEKGTDYVTSQDIEPSDESVEEIQTDEITTYYTGFEVYNVNHYDVFRNPLEAKDLLLEALEVQRLEQGNLFDGEKDGRMVKIMPVNRIATRADLSEIIAGLDYKTFERRQNEAPNKPVEKITLICMGHEPDLAATLISEVKPFNIDVEVVDILRDKSNLEFKRDSEVKIKIDGDYLIIDQFYPMNLLQKLSLQQENVEEWRELVESVMIDWNYDGAILEPKLVDIPDKKELVSGRYKIPEDAGTIRVKITDLLSESLEVNIEHG
jgi:adenine-specific DNA-methyltransferase